MSLVRLADEASCSAEQANSTKNVVPNDNDECLEPFVAFEVGLQAT